MTRPMNAKLPLFLLALCAALPLSAASGQIIRNTVPRYLATANRLGPADPSTTIDVSIWLKLHDRAGLDALAARLYNPSSPDYRHWLKPPEIGARFGPTSAEVEAVRKFFQSHNLSVVTVGAGNLYVRARGALGAVEKAFQVQIDNYSVGGATYFAPEGDPCVDGAAAGLVRAVSGLDNGGFSHPLVTRIPALPDPGGNSLPQAGPSAEFFTSKCFPGVKTEKFGTPGTYPLGTYRGNTYYGSAADPSPGCAYTPANLTAAYGLTGLYAEGYDGTGQTIAIVDWCGSPTVEADTNTFSRKFGLPKLTSSNFTITQVPVQSQCSGPDVEIDLDVQWAHAFAPGANISLIVPPSNTFQDTDEGLSYVVMNDLANVISNSYGAPESGLSGSELDTQNSINEMAAVAGISVNFASGDDGDYTAYGIPATVSAPADGTYATAVGGVTVALNSSNAIAWQTGWGNNQVLLVEPGSIFDPPFSFGFEYGSGGGPSAVFGKPSFQSALPGSWRLLPDISWVADPYTGVPVVVTEPLQSPPQVWTPIGGTSVSCPMFSALWAIANQEAGMPLGQAAPYLYSMPAGTITDVVPAGSSHDVTAKVQQSSSLTNTFDAGEVVGGAAPAVFFSAIWDDPFAGGVASVLTFGTDCSASTSGAGTLCSDPAALNTAVGWDNVTGLGTPNAQAFADFFRP